MLNVLLVIDMQKDFIDGALGTPEAQAIVDPTAEVIRNFPGRLIFATRDTHGPDYLETQEGRNLPVVHCVRDTPGWALHPKIETALEEWQGPIPEGPGSTSFRTTMMERHAVILDKPTFASRELMDRLCHLALTDELRITLTGLCTDICVVSNALLLKALLPETPIRVLASCCAGVTPQTHQAALDTMRMCQIEIV